MRFRRPFLELDGAVVVITGASSGIGRRTARRLARRGARVVLAARDRAALEETADACRADGAEVLVVPTDVSDPDAVTALARRAEERFGTIDAWINNAGVMAYGRFDEVPMAWQRQVLATNLLGAVHGAWEAMSRFVGQGHGLLVNVSSLYGAMTTPFVSSYVTSKFGLLGFSKVLRRDYRTERHIAVCCVMPSSMDTPIFRVAANHYGRPARSIPPVADPDRVARAIEGLFRRPRSQVRVGWFGRFSAMGELLASPVYDRVVNLAFRRLGFTGEEVPPSDGNLFEPAHDWQQPDGGWRNTTARRAAVGIATAAAAGAVVASTRNR